MSSLNKIAKSFRRIHKERSQPDARSNFGILPKKSDYKKRAKRHQQKAKMLRVYKEKAFNKNWDEFYFKMINMKPKDETIVLDANSMSKQTTLNADQSLLFKTQDINYLKYKRVINLKKIEKLRETSLENTHPNTHILFCDSDDEDEQPTIKPNDKLVLNASQGLKSAKQLQKRLMREKNLRELESEIYKKLDKTETYEMWVNDKLVTLPQRKL